MRALPNDDAIIIGSNAFDQQPQPMFPSPHLTNKKSKHYIVCVIDNFFQYLEAIDHNKVTM